MGQDNHAQIVSHCDQVDDREDSKERHLLLRIVCDPCEDKFSHLVHVSMIVFLHGVHPGYLSIKSILYILSGII